MKAASQKKSSAASLKKGEAKKRNSASASKTSPSSASAGKASSSKKKTSGKRKASGSAASTKRVKKESGAIGTKEGTRTTYFQSIWKSLTPAKRDVVSDVAISLDGDVLSVRKTRKCLERAGITKTDAKPKVKREPIGFIAFSMYNGKKSPFSEVDFKDKGKQLGAAWNGLSEAEKQRWRQGEFPSDFAKLTAKSKKPSSKKDNR